jgi:phage shock protein PspC (stress-responsive transcriptional regulator)
VLPDTDLVRDTAPWSTWIASPKTRSTAASRATTARAPPWASLPGRHSAALGQHFNVDVTIVRIAFAVLTVVGFTSLAYFAFIPLYLGGIPAYLACWVLIPEEGTDQSIAGRLLASRQHRPG